MDCVFRHPALIALTIITVLLMLVAPFTSGNLSSGEKEDRAIAGSLPPSASLPSPALSHVCEDGSEKGWRPPKRTRYVPHDSDPALTRWANN
jgi:hypothetical protein